MADGLFGGNFDVNALMSDPTMQLALSLLAQPNRNALGQRIPFGQQIGGAAQQFQQAQMALENLKAKKVAGQREERLAAEQARQVKQQQDFQQKLASGAFNDANGQIDWNKVQVAGITGGVLPLEQGLRVQEMEEGRKSREAMQKATLQQQEELKQATLQQQRGLAEERLQQQRMLAGMTNTIMQQNAGTQRQNAETQRMLAEARIAEIKQRQAANPAGNSPTYKSGVRILEQQAKVLPQFDEVENDLKRWQDLNAQVQTGPITGRRPISFDPNYQELETLQNKLAMNNFKPGQGQMSNFERALIVGGGPNTHNNPETNMHITAIMQGAVQNAREKQDFQSAWLESNKTLGGADTAWQKYLNDNPRFIKEARTKQIVPNTARQDWGTYFQGKLSTPTTPTFQSADEVKAAHKAGKLSRDEALRILRDQFRMQ